MSVRRQKKLFRFCWNFKYKTDMNEGGHIHTNRKQITRGNIASAEKYCRYLMIFNILEKNHTLQHMYSLGGWTPPRSHKMNVRGHELNTWEGNKKNTSMFALIFDFCFILFWNTRLFHLFMPLKLLKSKPVKRGHKSKMMATNDKDCCPTTSNTNSYVIQLNESLQKNYLMQCYGHDSFLHWHHSVLKNLPCISSVSKKATARFETCGISCDVKAEDAPPPSRSTKKDNSPVSSINEKQQPKRHQRSGAVHLV